MKSLMHAHMYSDVSCFLQPCGLWPARPVCLWNFSGKNTGVGCQFLLQGNLPDPGMELASPVSPALQAESLPLSNLGS